MLRINLIIKKILVLFKLFIKKTKYVTVLRNKSESYVKH